MVHEVPPVEQVRPGLWSVPVPIPNNPLGYTLVYLFETDRGPVLVDSGWDDDTTWKVLQEGFVTTGHDIRECYGVLVTHMHPDHHGLSGRVRDTVRRVGGDAPAGRVHPAAPVRDQRRVAATGGGHPARLRRARRGDRLAPHARRDRAR